MAIHFSGAAPPTEETDSKRCIGVERYEDRVWSSQQDCVAVEEPLEIRLGYSLAGRPAEKSLSVTMRTPGADDELAAGFLFGEGIIASGADIERIERVEAETPEAQGNILRVQVAADVDVDIGSLQRHFYTTSSCGVCGKASLEALSVDDCDPVEARDFRAHPELLCMLPARLRDAQDVFEDTGGLHAAGLFDVDGALVELHEDVGRHNAMDKLVGARLFAEQRRLGEGIVVLSGRASFELLQKALRASVPVVVAVGAPSSLAVRLAEAFGITLVGFARDDRLNIYSHPERITDSRVSRHHE